MLAVAARVLANQSACGLSEEGICERQDTQMSVPLHAYLLDDFSKCYKCYKYSRGACCVPAQMVVDLASMVGCAELAHTILVATAGQPEHRTASNIRVPFLPSSSR